MTVLDLATARPAAQALAGPSLPPRYDQGIVVAVVGTTVSLLVAGSQTVTPLVPYVASYFPTVGDTVVVGYFGDSPWVVGGLTPAAAVGPTIVCTSTTRPASPAGGQMIYETDTDRQMWSDGSNWRLTGNKTERVAANFDATVVSGTATEVARLTVNPGSGFPYKIDVDLYVHLFDTGASAFDVTLRQGGTAGTAGTGTAIRVWRVPAVTGDCAANFSGEVVAVPAGGSQLLRVDLTRIAGAGSLQAVNDPLHNILSARLIPS